jgi:quercetin dioxygenase-like cupin family protein
MDNFKRTAGSEIVEHVFGGEGFMTRRHLLMPEEMGKNGRLFAHNTLEKGCEVGRHRHHGDNETFYILSGQGKYLLNDEMIDVKAGDVLFVEDGQEHGMINTGDEPLNFIALVMYTLE